MIGSIFSRPSKIAIASPLKIDDVVIVEDEWGRIEEINVDFMLSVNIGITPSK